MHFFPHLEPVVSFQSADLLSCLEESGTEFVMRTQFRCFASTEQAPNTAAKQEQTAKTEEKKAENDQKAKQASEAAKKEEELVVIID